MTGTHWEIRTGLSSVSDDVRRRVAYGRQAGACSLKVPVWHSVEGGDLCEGRFLVPARLANPARNTNERHEFDLIVRDAIKRWAEWREKRGWTMADRPKVQGPFEMPRTTEKDPVDEEKVFYCVYAHFVRTGPVYIGLDDLLYEREIAEKFGISLDGPVLPWNPDEKGTDTGWVDPAAYAGKRRETLGIKREDYLFGAVSEPL